MVGCAVRSKMLTGRYLHGAHGAPYFDKTLNLLALALTLICFNRLIIIFIIEPGGRNKSLCHHHMLHSLPV